MSLVPRLRFKGFVGDWVEKKLGDMTKIKAGGTPNTEHSEYWGGTIRWMNSGELNLKQVFDVKNRITELGLQKSSTNIIPKYCILVGLAGQGKTRGTVAINHIELCTNQSIASIFPSPYYISQFIYYNLDGRYQELRLLSGNSEGRGGLNLGHLNNLKVNLPTLAEQQKIASFLTAIDKKIEGLQKKENLLKKYKQGVLQKIFNQEIRFKQDDGSEFPDWVEKKLGDFLYYLSERNKKKEISLVLSISNKNGFVTQSEQFDGYKVASNDLSTYKIVKKNDYAYNPSRINVGSIARLFNFDVGIVSPMYVCFSIQEMNHIFFDNLLKTEKIKNYILQSCVGSVRQSLNFDDLCLFKTNIPTLEEQELIANFLTALDKKIDITTNQLEKTRQYKTALLQQLFI